MTGQSQEHTLTSRGFFTKAEEALAQGELLQASEKLWGAAAYMVKAVAEGRGWEHSGHRELFQVVNRLANESGDLALRHLFNTANSLRSNFYENWMAEDWIEAGAKQVGEFLEKLESLP